MKNIELLISKLEKEVGPLKETQGRSFQGSGYYAFEFMHKQQNTLKILLIEAQPNHWVIHHELCWEDAFLLKRAAQICVRIQRIKDGKKVSFSLSADLQEILKQNIIILAIKSSLQNLLSKFPLFHNMEEKNGSVSKKDFAAERNKWSFQKIILKGVFGGKMKTEEE